MVDWGMARQVARFAARSDDVPDLDIDIAAVAEQIAPAVIAYAGLEPAGALPPAEVIGRQSWAQANLSSLSSLLEPVADRMEARFESAGPFAGALRAGAGVTLAAEVGLVTGYMSQRVLGQYELSLLGPESPARLLFVAPNLVGAAEALNVDSASFLRWVTIHELVHALQFGAVPWLRGHLGTLMRDYLDTVEVRIDRGAAGGLPSLPDVGKLVDRFREGGLAALVQSSEQRAIFDRVQATMAVVEGHAEHLMDALAPELVPEHEGLRTAMDARRASRSAPERVLMRLLGMDQKMRQYELGKGFCDWVAAEGGIDLLNRVWESPELLPSMTELRDPAVWSARAAVTATA